MAIATSTGRIDLQGLCFWMIPITSTVALAVFVTGGMWEVFPWFRWGLVAVCAPFWFFILISVVGAIVSAILAERFRARTKTLPQSDTVLPVAVFYTCCDDFRPECAVTLLDQTHPDLHLFVLDDSENASERERVKAWCATRQQSVTLLRRSSREGFKAGNLNHGLAQLSERWVAVLVCDADQRLGRRTVSELAAWLVFDSRLAWVQALHSAGAPEGTFATALGPLVRCVWHFLMPWRVWFGLPCILGHGVILRRTALTAAHGFPEATSEDILLTARLVELGWKGTCAWTTDGAEEDVPKSYPRYQRRLRRWTRQDAQTAWCETMPMLRHSQVPLAARLDWILRNLRHPACGVVLPVFWVCGVLTLCDIPPQSNHLLLAIAFGVVMFLPAVLLALGCGRKLRQLPSLYAASMAVSIISAPAFCLGLVSSIRSRPHTFVPTGSSDASRNDDRASSLLSIASGAFLIATGYIGSEPLLIVLGTIYLASPFLVPRLPFQIFAFGVVGALLLGIALHVCGFGTLPCALLLATGVAMLMSGY